MERREGEILGVVIWGSGNAEMVREPFGRRGPRSEGSEHTRFATVRLCLYHVISGVAGLDDAVRVRRPEKGGARLTGCFLQIVLKAKQQEVILKPIGAGKRVIDQSRPAHSHAERGQPNPDPDSKRQDRGENYVANGRHEWIIFGTLQAGDASRNGQAFAVAPL
jgi:hypothetical protein